ncbi:diguanylate cyclase [Halomonas sp. MCCC 1A11062]|jgi:predicted signal transduction protein with EAL and GGDEF domain|nr:diguanylate cyclase [Halomonas sp. MCCC 1A11062]
MASGHHAACPARDSCVGIAIYPNDTQDLDTLFTLADNAMYQDKTASRAAAMGKA